MFSENLKSIMQQKGVSAAGLSRLTGIGKPNISNWIHNLHEPKPETVKIVADALGCSIEELIGAQQHDATQPENAVKLTISEAALRCGKSREFIAGWLQDGNCPFGYARKGKGEKIDSFISAMRLEKWLAGEL